MRRLKIAIRGAVQGVGFRPFVYRLAGEKGLAGWVKNSPQGVFIGAEGPEQSLEYSVLEPVGYPDFRIRGSLDGGEKQALILPDIATCPICGEEVFSPGDRRCGYPCTNCTLCGPRFSMGVPRLIPPPALPATRAAAPVG